MCVCVRMYVYLYVFCDDNVCVSGVVDVVVFPMMITCVVLLMLLFFL